MTNIDFNEFKQMKNYENIYWINKNGDICNKNNKILKSRDNGNGYLIIDLCKDGVRKTLSVHRLTALTYLIESNNNFTDIDHIDGNRKNNNINNLRYIDKSGNNRNTRKYNKTGYRGVYASGNKYKSCIRIDGKKTHLGCFLSAQEANNAYELKYNQLMSVY